MVLKATKTAVERLWSRSSHLRPNTIPGPEPAMGGDRQPEPPNAFPGTRPAVEGDQQPKPTDTNPGLGPVMGGDQHPEPMARENAAPTPMCPTCSEGRCSTHKGGQRGDGRGTTDAGPWQPRGEAREISQAWPWEQKVPGGPWPTQGWRRVGAASQAACKIAFPRASLSNTRAAPLPRQILWLAQTALPQPLLPCPQLWRQRGHQGRKEGGEAWY